MWLVIGLFTSIVLDTWCTLSIQKCISFHSEKCNWTISLTVSYSLLSLFFLSGTPFIQVFGLLEHSDFLCFHSFMFWLLAVSFISLLIYLMFYIPILIIFKLSVFFFDCLLFCFMDSGKFWYCQNICSLCLLGLTMQLNYNSCTVESDLDIWLVLVNAMIVEMTCPTSEQKLWESLCDSTILFSPLC